MAEAKMQYDFFSWTRQLSDDFFLKCLEPKKIIKSADRTIVFWKDDTKTIVKRSDDTEDDLYSAFCAALAIKIYGSNSQVKKILRTKVEVVPLSDRLKKKKEEANRKLNEKLREKEEAERPQKILEEYIDPDPIQTELTNFGKELREQLGKAVENISSRYKKDKS